MLDKNVLHKPNFMSGNFINNNNFIKLDNRIPKYRMKILSEIIDLTIGDIQDMRMADLIQEEIKE